jgi:small GTP-binding protein
MMFVGDTHVGKTSIINQFSGGICPTYHLLTIGVDYATTRHGGNKFQIWDTAGDPKFQGQIDVYLKSIDIVVIVFDLTHRESMTQIPEWYHRIKSHNPQAIIAIVGNKVDLADQRDIGGISEEIDLILPCPGLGVEVMCFEVSAKTTIGITSMFETLAWDHSQKFGPGDHISDSDLVSDSDHDPEHHKKWTHERCCVIL